jgi:aspartokinase-like uncharacterized kinase
VKVSTVVKVGGSLFDRPDLGGRLAAFVGQWDKEPVVVVPGGGAAADAVRAWDRVQRLGDEVSHWLALRAMALSAEFLAALLRRSGVRVDVVDRPGASCRGVEVVDAWAFCRADDAGPDRLPHSWAATSDSVAARVAHVAGAAQLVLLKSCPPGPSDFVDPCFGDLVRRYRLRVLAVDFTTSTTSGVARTP